MRRSEGARTPGRRAGGEPVERQIDHRRGEQGEHLRHQQAADDGDAQRLAQLRAHACAQRQRHRAEQRGKGGHQNGPQPQVRRLQHGLIGRQALVALRVQREVHHQNGVFLHDADEQNDADDGDHREVMPGGHQRQQRADAGRGQGGQNGDRVDVALIQHAQHDIHGGHSGEQQPELVGQRRLKGAGRALEGDGHRGGQRSLLGRLLDRVDRFAQRHAGRELEGNERRRKLAQMVDGQRRGARLDGGDGGQRHRLPVASGEIHAVERGQPLVGLFFHPEHHAVLRRLGEDGRHQPLAEGVVQRAVDRAHADAQARGRAAVHVHISLQALVLQIAGHAGELR